MVNSTPPAFFVRGPTPYVQVAVYALLSILLMVVDAHQHYLNHVRDAVSVAVYPLQRLAQAPVELTHRAMEFFVSHARLNQENQELKEQRLIHSVQLQNLARLEKENLHLRSLLELPARGGYENIAAEILHVPRDPFSRKVLINKGSAQGLRAGLPVVDNQGVVGQVTRVFPLSAEVTLITDKSQMVPVQVVRTGQRAIVFGLGQPGALSLSYLPVSSDIVSGDTLVTSGIDGVYPAGLAVAAINSVERNAAFAFAKVECTPSAGIDRHAQLLVLVPTGETAP